jgi:hypothetical protein
MAPHFGPQGNCALRTLQQHASRRVDREKGLCALPPAGDHAAHLLGGSFPIICPISGFLWSFFEIADVSVSVSLAMTALFLAVCLVIIWWIFKTGYRLKQ